MKRGGPLKRLKQLRRSGFKAKRKGEEKLERSKKLVWRRDDGKCRICKGTFHLQVHHIVPRARGIGWKGLHEPANLVLLCCVCHQGVHDASLPGWEEWLRRRPLS